MTCEFWKNQKKHHAHALTLPWQNLLAFCELEIEGNFKKLSNNYVKFNSRLPVINKVEISINNKNWIDAEFENIYEEYLNIDIGYENNRLINKKTLIQNIINNEDSVRGQNLCVYLPLSIVKQITPTASFNIKFYYTFIYDSRTQANQDFDSYYLKLFSTPSDVNFPTAGYKPCLWMPCLNLSVFSTTWKIFVSTPHDMMTITPGYLTGLTDSDNPETKIWQFSVDTLTTAGNITIITGYFNNVEISREVTGYSSPGLQHLLLPSLKYLPNLLQHFISDYNFDLPHKNLQIVFLSRTKKCKIFSNVMLFPASILCLCENILQMQKNYRLFLHALTDYIFGSLILPRTIADIWLICGLSQYFYYTFYKKIFGLCEFSKLYKKEQRRASSDPNLFQTTPFYLCPHIFIANSFTDSIDNISPAAALIKWFTTSHPMLLCGNKIWKSFSARCGLTIMSIEKSVTQNHLLQVITKILTFKSSEIFPFNRPSTEFFFTSILNISGKDVFLQVCRNWLSVSRPLLLSLEYAFNRRRSSVEVTIINEEYETESNIPVNISITIQELDGAFEHLSQINRDSRRSTLELSVHSSKSRRSNLKRRVTTENGREIDIELIQSSTVAKTVDGILNTDNPVLWLRVNMEQCSFYGEVNITQSDSAWYYQASLESNPISHLKAVKMLASFPSEECIVLLGKLIKNKSCWYQIRSNAFKSLLPKINDFSNIPLHLFQLSAIKSLGKLKMLLIKDISKPRVFVCYELLRTFYEYNDNTSNKYDDCCYRACLLDAVGDSLQQLKNDLLNDASSFVLTESINSLKIDEMFPYFHTCLSYSSICNILRLQKHKYIEYDPTGFVHCCLPGIPERLRLSSLKCLSEYIQMTQSINEYKYILNLILHDPSLFFRKACVRALIKFPPFQVFLIFVYLRQNMKLPFQRRKGYHKSMESGTNELPSNAILELNHKGMLKFVLIESLKIVYISEGARKLKFY
ncbi:hypothetical protein HZS_2423 [Henneguya salminicola]|nr:hypothetical protein HZS_2423 [Henneguya salminicola]